MDTWIKRLNNNDPTFTSLVILRKLSDDDLILLLEAIRHNEFLKELSYHRFNIDSTNIIEKIVATLTYKDMNVCFKLDSNKLLQCLLDTNEPVQSGQYLFNRIQLDHLNSFDLISGVLTKYSGWVTRELCLKQCKWATIEIEYRIPRLILLECEFDSLVKCEDLEIYNCIIGSKFTIDLNNLKTLVFVQEEEISIDFIGTPSELQKCCIRKVLFSREVLYSMRNLVQLELRDCKLVEFDCSKFQFLSRLDLTSNSISVFDICNPSLIELILFDNKIVRLTCKEKSRNKLELLDLGYNFCLDKEELYNFIASSSLKQIILGGIIETLEKEEEKQEFNLLIDQISKDFNILVIK